MASLGSLVVKLVAVHVEERGFGSHKSPFEVPNPYWNQVGATAQAISFLEKVCAQLQNVYTLMMMMKWITINCKLYYITMKTLFQDVYSLLKPLLLYKDE